jgi:hypothetical protein
MASYPFFTSQGSFGYLLSQENSYLTPQLLPSSFSEVLKWVLATDLTSAG